MNIFSHKISVLRLFLIVLLGIASSCSTGESDKVEAVRSLTIEEINRLSPGMSFDEVREICGPYLPGTVPVFGYPAKSGGRYMLSFLPTKEIDSYGEHEALSLVAIIQVDGKSGSELEGGVYILPKRLTGSICSGLGSLENLKAVGEKSNRQTNWHVGSPTCATNHSKENAGVPK